jgi:hypothetical protein
VFSTIALLPLVSKLGDYLRAAGEHAKHAVTSGGNATPEVIAAILEREMADWKPTLSGRLLLDPETRRHAARFLAGVAVNVVAGTKER